MSSTNQPPERSIEVQINGQPHGIPGDWSVAQLLDSLGVPAAGTAVELAGEIVPATDYDKRHLVAGQHVEIVRLVGGG